MHGVLHTFYDAQRYQREIVDEDLLEQFRSELAAAGIADRYQYDLYLRQGREQLRHFFEIARAAPPPEVIETEHKFELLLGSAELTGRVDRMDRTGPDTVAIVDYKTGKPKSQEDADESLQLSLYAIAAQETLGKHADRLVFHNLENNTAVCTTRTDARIGSGKVAGAKSGGQIARESSRRIPSITARFVPIAICVRRRRSRSQPRRRNRTRASTKRGDGWTPSLHQHKSPAKNFGDAHRVPFVVACCSCLVLLAGLLLCFLFGCHGSILPFHSSWNFTTIFCCNYLNV